MQAVAPLAGPGLAPLPELAATGPRLQKRQVTAVQQLLPELVIAARLVVPEHLRQSLQQSAASSHFRPLRLARTGS